MRLSNDRVILRDFIQSDIEKRGYWETIETEWQLWDAPWEYENVSDERKHKELNEYIQNMHEWVNKFASMADDEKRSGFQICVKDTNEYIGWCGSYRIDGDCNYSPQGDMCAIGIDIPALSARGKGYAYSALVLFIDYLYSIGETDIYTQTWSGNTRMIGLAEKLGFEEFKRKPHLRTVRGHKYDGLTLRLNQHKYQQIKHAQYKSGKAYC